jgi:hypothetical protein
MGYRGANPCGLFNCYEVLGAKAEENQTKETGPEEHTGTKRREPDSFGGLLLVTVDF